MMMSKLIKVVNVYFDEEPEYPGVNSGLVLELEDGRMLKHSQDGYVVPFSEIKTLTTTTNGTLELPEQEDLDPDIARIVGENFEDLIDTTNGKEE